MNQFRRRLVSQAFQKVDADRNGYLEVSDLKQFYNAKKHPDVLSGKKTEEDVLLEFLETFEEQHDSEQRVTLEEFTEYYSNVSASIDNDQYFELMMNNAWRLNEANKSYSKGWSNQASP